MSEHKCITYQIHKDAFSFLGIINIVTDDADFGYFWDHFFSVGGYDKILPYATDPKPVNIWFTNEKGEEIYFQGLFVENVNEISEGYTLMEFPASDFIVVTHEWMATNAEALGYGINAGWENEKKVQIPDGYVRTDSPVTIIERENCDTPEGSRYEMWVPIRRTSNRIRNYRRIENWENFFLDSAIYSVAVALGVEYDNGFTPIAGVTGDLFTYMYSDTAPCDSGVTDYVVMPEVVPTAFASFGYDCEYLSPERIQADLPAALAKIRASVDRGIPVLAWGIGGVPRKNGSGYDTLDEGTLIGGYEEDCLLVQLYPGAERLAPVSFGGRPGVDEDGYTALPTEDALSGTHGIFIAGEKNTEKTPDAIHRQAVRAIPRWLTMPPTEEWIFGKAAFARWAEVLLDDTVWQTPAGCNEDLIWNKHCSPYCAICTSTGSFGGDSRAVEYLNQVAAVCPDLTVISKLVPLYRKLCELSQQIWAIHGGFMPPTEKMQDHKYRAQLAEILLRMGACCDNILQVFLDEKLI